MSAPNCRSVDGPESLRHELHLPVGTNGNLLGVRIAIGALAGLALAVLASLPAEKPAPRSQGEGIVVPGSAPAPEIKLDGHGKWGGYTR